MKICINRTNSFYSFCRPIADFTTTSYNKTELIFTLPGQSHTCINNTWRRYYYDNIIIFYMKICINSTNRSYSYRFNVGFTTTAYRNKTELLFTQSGQSQSYIQYPWNWYYYYIPWFYMKICINKTNSSYLFSISIADYTTYHNKTELKFPLTYQSSSSSYIEDNGTVYYYWYYSIWKFVLTTTVAIFHASVT